MFGRNHDSHIVRIVMLQATGSIGENEEIVRNPS
jgi:hypothetical protein